MNNNNNFGFCGVLGARRAGVKKKLRRIEEDKAKIPARSTR